MEKELEIFVMVAGIKQKINGIDQEVRMCILSEPGKNIIEGPTEKAIFFKDHLKIVNELQTKIIELSENLESKK